MKTNTAFRIAGAGLIALGSFNLYCAAFGGLWTYPDVPILLRPMLVATGAVGVVYGLWHLWLSGTTFGRVLLSWRECVQQERRIDAHMAAMDGIEDDESPLMPFTWRDSIRILWSMRGCMIGRHPARELWHCQGGEDGPRGAYCQLCDLYVGPYNPPVSDMVAILDQYVDRCFTCYRPISEHEVGEYDDECPRRRWEDNYDDGQPNLVADDCFTQSSDPVLRRVFGKDRA